MNSLQHQFRDSLLIKQRDFSLSEWTLICTMSGKRLKDNVIGGLVVMLALIPFTWHSMRSSRRASFSPDDVSPELFGL